jgi:hypothetical protein
MQAFVQYLIERGLVPEPVGRRLAHRHSVREPIGMIAVSHGLISPMEIDVILDRQRATQEKFGEAAVALGMLTAEQVDLLIKIQEFRSSSEIAEALALSGTLTIEDAARYLGAFLVRDRELASIIEGQ